MLVGYFLFCELPVTSIVGGVGFFIKKTISCKLRNDLKLITTADVRIEDLWFDLIKDNRKYIIGGVYRHPNQSIDKFNLLEPNLCLISNMNVPCFIVGDINIDLLKFSSSTNIECYVNKLLIHNFLPTILLPTRITNRSISLIDHIYYFQGRNNKKGFIVSSGNIFSDVSDHLPSFLLLSDNTTAPGRAKKNRPFH